MKDFKLGQIVWFLNKHKEFESRVICHIDQYREGGNNEWGKVALYTHRLPFVGDINLCEASIREIFKTEQEAINSQINKLVQLKDIVAMNGQCRCDENKTS